MKVLLFQRRPWLPDLFCGAVIFMAALAATRYFLGSLVIESEDTYAGLLRLIGLVQVWGDGQFVGRWLPDINFGYGYSLFNFYPPLFYYVAGAIFFMVRDYLLAANMAIVLSFFLSGLGMYLLTRDLFGRAGALLSAVAYMFAPFHLCDIYRRTAFAQTFAYIFFPFIIWSMSRLFARAGAAAFIGIVLSVSGLLLAHNMSMVLFFPVIVAYLLFLSVMASAGERKKAWMVFLAIMCAFGLTAFYWIPANVELKYVSHSNIYGGQGDYHQHFMTLYQLVFAPWTYGHLGGGMGRSFQLGWVHMLMALGAMLFVVKGWRVRSGLARTQLFWVAVALAAGFMTLGYSAFIWEAFPPLKYIQFPWRIFSVISFALSLIVGGVVLWCEGKWRWLLAGVGVIVLVAVNTQFMDPIGKMRTYEIKDARQFLFNTRPMDSMGFLPKSVKAVPVTAPQQQFEVIQGRALIESRSKGSSSRHFLRLNAYTPALVCFHQFYFPGWKVTVDGKAVEIDFDNPWGVIVFDVPAGIHDIKVSLVQTPLRFAAGLVSWVTLFVIAGISYFYLRRRRKA